MNKNSAKNEVFTSKANVLKFLSPKIKKSKIEKIFDFTLGNWEKKSDSIIKKIQSEFYSNDIIVRSSAIGEDSEYLSQAGNYESIQHVDSKSVLQTKKAIQQVIKSYKIKGTSNKNDQILIQTQTNNVITSGVVFTRTPENGAPYFIINYEDGFTTDGVTKGHVGNTIKIFRGTNKKKIPDKWSSLITSIQEIENLLCTDLLDIEFGITQKEIIVFQVRPITSTKNKPREIIEKKIFQMVKKNKKIYEKMNNENKKLRKITIFSDMSDWNPAEIIGNSPNVLDYSLYDLLIMKKNWHAGRKILGYQNMHNSRLMLKFGNKPFVDVICSVNSFIPDEIPNKLKQKLVNYYLKKIIKNPHLHDKIEFDIVFSCYDFNIKLRLKELEKNGFNKNEINIIENILKKFTNNILQNFPHFEEQSLLSITKMNEKRENILKKLNQSKSNVNDISNAIENLLKDCSKFGTYPFSIMARIAFIGSIILKSLAKKGILEPNFVDSLMNSISTPLSEIQADLLLLKNKKITKSTFLKKYGHLRPGTYDITAKRYDQSKGFFEKLQNLQKIKHGKKVSSKSINPLLIKHGINISEKDLFEFVKKSLVLREKLKFEFTKNLSDSLELIAKLGKILGFSRQQIAHIDINFIIKNRNIPKSEMKKLFNKKISINLKNKIINDYLFFPSIITDINDFEILEYHLAKPNFISQKRVIGKVEKIEKSYDRIPNLEGKIVVIEKADPGYDWIFTKNPLGLITKYGGVASHMAIRCAEIGLPAAIGIGEIIFERIKSKSKIDLDCQNESLIILQDKSNDPYFREKQVLKSLGYIR